MTDADLVQGTAVQEAKAALAKALGRNAGGPTEAVEDDALELVREGVSPRKSEVLTALHVYQEAINRFWSRVYSDGTVEFIGRVFASKHSSLASAVGRVDYEAEIALQLRTQISRYLPESQVPFRAWATHNLLLHLLDWAKASLAAVRIPQKQMRAAAAQGCRSFDDGEPHPSSRDPHDPRALDPQPASQWPDGVWRQKSDVPDSK